MKFKLVIFQGKGKEASKKNEKKVGFSNHSMDATNGTVKTKSNNYPDPTDVIVEEIEDEEEKKKEEDDPSLQVKDDGHIMLVLKVSTRKKLLRKLHNFCGRSAHNNTFISQS